MYNKQIKGMINEEDEPRSRDLQYQEDFEEEVTDYSHVTKHAYVNQVFGWIGMNEQQFIEKGDTKKIINFFNTFPHLINSFYTPNNWNPFMYAVRYANMDLINYFNQKGMRTTVNSTFNHVSLVHTAVYSGEIKILKHVLHVMKISPNPPNSETSPLKIAMKVGNSKMVQMLICKGAYYVFGDVYNNVEPRVPVSEEGCKYLVYGTGRQISNNTVVEDNSIKDCAIKETLRWARLRQIMHLYKSAKNLKAREEEGVEDQNPKFKALADILANQTNMFSIFKILLGKGESIFSKTEPSESEPKNIENSKDAKEKDIKSK